MQTIAVIPVEPRGVLQFGSPYKVGLIYAPNILIEISN